MDREKFSKFFYECRKRKNMTQQEVADYLFISDKSISKWERGISLPDISLYPKIAQLFELSISELLFLEIDKNNDSLWFEKIKNIVKKRKRERTIFVILFWIFFFLLCYFGIYFIRYQNTYFYSFGGQSSHFSLSGGHAFYGNDRISFSSGSIFLLPTSTISLEDISSAEFSISFDHSFWGSISYDASMGSFSHWLSEIHLSEIGKISNEMTDSFSRSKANEFPENMQMVLRFCSMDSCYNEEFSLYSTKFIPF